MSNLNTDIEQDLHEAAASTATALMNQMFVELDIPAIASVVDGKVAVDTSLDEQVMEPVLEVMDGVIDVLERKGGLIPVVVVR